MKKTKFFSIVLSNIQTKASIFLWILIISTTTSCLRSASNEVVIEKKVSSKNKYDSSLLISCYGKDVIILPGKDTIPKKFINDSIYMLAFKLLNSPSIEEIMVSEWISVTDSSGKLIIYSVSHIHDASPNGKKNGNAIEIFSREVTGGLILAGAKKIKCNIGNGI